MESPRPEIDHSIFDSEFVPPSSAAFNVELPVRRSRIEDLGSRSHKLCDEAEALRDFLESKIEEEGVDFNVLPDLIELLEEVDGEGGLVGKAKSIRRLFNSGKTAMPEKYQNLEEDSGEVERRVLDLRVRIDEIKGVLKDLGIKPPGNGG